MSSGNLAYVKQYLRRKYSADIPGLRRLADEIFEEATETVTITSNSSEGGSAAGVVQFPKALMGRAVEELLLELSPTDTPSPRSSLVYKDFSSRPASV